MKESRGPLWWRLRSWLRWRWLRLTCRHRWHPQYNLYGDSINFHGGKRSCWQCAICKRYEYRGYLIENPPLTVLSKKG